MSVLVDWQIRDLCVVPNKDAAEEHMNVWKNYMNWFKDESGNCLPMLEPFSEAVNGEGIISYGLSSHGYDLILGEEFAFINDHRTGKYGETPVIDPMRLKRDDKEYEHQIIHRIKTNLPVVIPPNATVIGRSREYIRMPNWLMGTALGKSTYARCGIIAYITPLEAQWQGQLAIEISNLNPIPAVVYPNMGIAQITFHKLDATPEKDYVVRGGRYNKQTGVTLARV